MTEVIIRADACPVGGRELTRFQLMVMGQSEAAGNTALLAAQSILMQTLGCRLAAATADELWDFNVDGVPGRDWCAISAVPTETGYERIRGVFESAALGFCLLADHWPEQLRVRLAHEPSEPVRACA